MTRTHVAQAHEDTEAPLIVLEGVHKAFGSQRVLRGLSLSVSRGEALVVTGPSGGGKTVLLKHAIGLLQPERGRLWVAGRDFWAVGARERNALRSRMGYVFQEGALFDSMTVAENVGFPLRREGRLTAAQVEARVEECLALVHLSGTQGRLPAELSTGMRRRVGIARALTRQPEILLFDEPTAGLDPMLVTVIDGIIRELTERLSVTTITVTHDLRTAQTVGSRIALLSGGVLVADAPGEAFFALPDPAVRQWIEGSPEGPLLAEEERGQRGGVGP